MEQSGEDEGKKEIIHIKNTAATEGSKYCTMKNYSDRSSANETKDSTFLLQFHAQKTVP